MGKGNGGRWHPVYLKILEDDIFKYPDKRLITLFITMFLRANWTAREQKGVRILRGEWLTSYGIMAKILNESPSDDFYRLTGMNRVFKKKHQVTRKHVRRYVEILEALGSITTRLVPIKCTKSNTIVPQQSPDSSHNRAQPARVHQVVVKLTKYDDYARPTPGAETECAPQQSRDSSPIGATLIDKEIDLKTPSGDGEPVKPKPRPRKKRKPKVTAPIPELGLKKWTPESIEKVTSIRNVNELFIFLVEYSMVHFPLRKDSAIIPQKIELGSSGARIGVAKKFLSDWGGSRSVTLIKYYVRLHEPNDFERQSHDGFGTLKNLAWSATKIVSKAMSVPKEKPMIEKSGGLVRGKDGRWV